MAKVNYLPYEYGKNPFTKLILDAEREDPMQKRMEGATAFFGKAEEIHQRVLRKIQEYFPKLERTCFSKMGTDSLGCLLRDKKGVQHPLVNGLVAELLRSSQFDHFRSYNLQQGTDVTPEDFLANVVAHEYGHIALDEFLQRGISKYGAITYSSNLNFFNSLSTERENDEGFAFWFGDSISRTKTNIPNVAPHYGGIDPAQLKRVYDALSSLSDRNGLGYVLDSQNLVPIFKR